MIIAVVSPRSGSGKTLFLERLVGELSRRGCRIPVIKHIHHGKMDLQRKDTERIFTAGAWMAVGIAGGMAMILVREISLPRILELARELTGSSVVLAEGFRGQAIADKYIYILADGGLEECMELMDRGLLLLATSLDGLDGVECRPYYPFDEAVRRASEYIMAMC